MNGKHTPSYVPTASMCPGRSLAFAINHFTGSRDFLRALRYWGNHATAAVAAARALHKDATGFRISEHGLVPIAKSGSYREGRGYKTNSVRALAA